MTNKNTSIGSPEPCETEKLEIKYPRAVIPTITLQDRTFTFMEALERLRAGECIGIKPQDNTSYIELYVGEYSSELLRWTKHPNERIPGSRDDGCSIRVDQYAGEWYLVVLDSKAIRKGNVRLIYVDV